jgi:hypothetical protein
MIALARRCVLLGTNCCLGDSAEPRLAGVIILFGGATMDAVLTFMAML